MMKIVILAILLFNGAAFSQTQIGRSVIGSAGEESSSATIILSSTVGEVAVSTQANNIVITEGFQQAISVNSLLSFNVNVQHASCRGLSNGYAEVINLSGCNSPYQVLWSNGQSGNRATNLTPGNYSVQVISDDGCQSQNYNFSVELLNEECKLKFYSGITPNADGVNDRWEIDNVTLYPENVVNIFDRRGNLVYSGKNYDNKNEVWKGDSKNGKPLPSGTYFFIFESDELTQKGWIELTR